MADEDLKKIIRETLNAPDAEIDDALLCTGYATFMLKGDLPLLIVALRFPGVVKVALIPMETSLRLANDIARSVEKFVKHEEKTEEH